MKIYYVYIMASQRNGTLYTGITSDVGRRAWEHREGRAHGFTKSYRVKKLVHLENYPDVQSAIEREKKLKKWKREYKLALIEKDNPDWKDLYLTLNH